jgi:hypothetical protein
MKSSARRAGLLRPLPVLVVCLLAQAGCDRVAVSLHKDEPSTEATPAQAGPGRPAKPSRPSPPSAAQLHEQRLEASDGAPFDHLGFSVAAYGDVVVSGARFADAANGAEDSGAVYVFRRGAAGWHEEAKLVPSDPVEHDRFGHAVALDGDTLVVGAHAHHELGRKAGSAYVFRFRRGAWRQEARLAAPEASRFGHAVGISGDRLVVGAPGGLVEGAAAGAVYVYRRQGSSWRREARLTAGDAREGHLFGLAVGISGDTVAAGAPGDDARGSLTGAAYVFRGEGRDWRQEAKLLPADAAALGELGKAIAIEGDTVVVGAEGAGHPRDVGQFSGAAYVFGRQGGSWKEQATLLAEDRKAADRFGNAVSIHGETIVAGAHFADPAGLGSGAAYLFRRVNDQWRQEAKLVPKEAAAGEEFGNAVAVHGDTIAVGALRGGAEGTAAGSVSVFERIGSSGRQP